MACGLNVITGTGTGSAVGPSATPPVGQAATTAINQATQLAKQKLANFKCPATCRFKSLVTQQPAQLSNWKFTSVGAGKTQVQVTATVSMVVSCWRPVVVLSIPDLIKAVEALQKP